MPAHQRRVFLSTSIQQAAPRVLSAFHEEEKEDEEEDERRQQSRLLMATEVTARHSDPCSCHCRLRPVLLAPLPAWTKGGGGGGEEKEEGEEEGLGILSALNGILSALRSCGILSALDGAFSTLKYGVVCYLSLMVFFPPLVFALDGVLSALRVFLSGLGVFFLPLWCACPPRAR